MGLVLSTHQELLYIALIAIPFAMMILSKLRDTEDGADDRLDENKLTLSRFKNGRYYNPFEGWRERTFITFLKWIFFHRNRTNLPGKEELNRTLPVLTPNFDNAPPDERLRLTWLGHATTLVQFDGVTVLTDPIFSERCGPWQIPVLSYKRFRPAPCTVRDLPDVHAVVITHSHHDHLDFHSVVDLNARFQEKLHWFVPQGLQPWFNSLGCQNVHELNWWKEESMPNRPDVKFVFTPTQHWSGRFLFDHHKTLWGSWCVIGPKHRFYFAGDTGYCKAFRQIGEKYGPFDLAAIPIGAYLPREIMAPQHVDPSQAVSIHTDVKAKQSVGIHWGTFALAYEPYLAPPADLKKALEERGIPEDDFFVMKHGEQRDL